MLYGKARKSEQRREALLAQLNVDAELLLGKDSSLETQPFKYLDKKNKIRVSCISKGNKYM
jgi:hypothetical protein